LEEAFPLIIIIFWFVCENVINYAISKCEKKKKKKNNFRCLKVTLKEITIRTSLPLYSIVVSTGILTRNVGDKIAKCGKYKCIRLLVIGKNRSDCTSPLPVKGYKI
jgi:hypothetical protein